MFPIPYMNICIKTIVKKQETTFLVTRTEAGQLGT